MVPQLFGHAGPLRLQRIVISGWLELVIVAANFCWAPNSTEDAPAMDTAMSLVRVSCAFALLVRSAAREAVIFTLVANGRSDGAVYSPADEIVPVASVPPRMPFTRQFTAVSLVPVMVAASCRVLPSNTLPVFGVIEMLIAGEGGGLLTGLVVPPSQRERVC